MKNVLGMALVATALTSNVSAEPNGSLGLGDLDAQVEKAMEAGNVPGMSLAVVVGDKVLVAKGYGTKTLGQADPVDGETLFPIASLTKAFTSTAIGLLVDEGKLSWDDRLIAHVPGFRVADPYVTVEATIRDALAHRTGVQRSDFMWVVDEMMPRAEAMRRMQYMPQQFPFRSHWQYNNYIYMIAGEAIKGVTGQDYGAFVEERLLAPLGMVSSHTSVSKFKEGQNFVTPHELVGGKLQPVPFHNLDTLAPAGGVNSNAADMARWCKFNLARGKIDGKQIVSEQTMAEILKPQMVLPGSPYADLGMGYDYASYTLGWGYLDYRGNSPLLIHTGGIDGISTTISMDLEHQVCVVALTNHSSAHGAGFAVANFVLDRVIGLEAKDWTVAAKSNAEGQEKMFADRRDAVFGDGVVGVVPSLDLASFSGAYSNNLYGDITVSVEDGDLVIQIGKDAHGTLRHKHFNVFEAEFDGTDFGVVGVAFTQAPKGNIDGLELLGYFSKERYSRKDD